MNIVAILLAAGHGTRFGGDKLLYPLPTGEPIGVAAAQNLISVFEHCIVVVREIDLRLQQVLMPLKCQVIPQIRPDAGMGDNLALGIAASSDADGWAIGLGDMPWVQAETLRQLKYNLENGAPITAPTYRRQRGHPVGFNRCFRDALLTLQGDKGAKAILKHHPVDLFSVNDSGVLRDVDTKQDYELYCDWLQTKLF